MPVFPGNVVAYRDGSVDWITDRGSLKPPDGAWRIVQELASIGIPKTGAIGQELTI